MKMILLLSLAFFPTTLATASPHELSVADYPSIQDALQANPGRILYVPSGDHFISKK